MYRGITKSLATVCIAFTTGCAGISSVDIGSSQDTRLGTSYYVPTTVIPVMVTVAKNTGTITISAEQPIFVPDVAAGEFRLNSVYSPVHAEDVGLKTTKSGLLTNIDYTSDARLDEALVNLVKSGTALLRPEFGSAAGSSYRANIDLNDLAKRGDGNLNQSAINQLNQNVNAWLKGAVSGVSTGFLKDAGGEEQIVTISVRRLHQPPASSRGDERDMCHVGFCYRRAIPYVVRAEFFDQSVQEEIVEVPTGAPIRAAALNRGLFTKWTNTVVLENGMLTQYKYVTDASEAERLALLPFELVGGAVDGLTKQGSLWDAKSTRITKELAYREKLLELRDASTPTDGQTAESLNASTRLFTFTAGDVETVGGSLNQRQSQSGSGVVIQGPSGPATGGNPGAGG